MKKMRVMSISLSLLILISLFAPVFIIRPVAAQTTPIKIGIFAPFTGGGLQLYAPWTQQGFELGMIYATTMMGYDNENKTQAGRPYELHYYDTQSSTTVAANLATQAFETDGIDILVGGTSSSVASVLAAKAEEYQKLYFITPAASSSLTAEEFNPYIFRIARNNWHDAYAGVKYAMDTLGYTKFAFLGADYSFGRFGVEAMAQLVQDKGGTVVAKFYDSLAETDFQPTIDALIAADAVNDIEYLFVVWAGNFVYLYNDLFQYNLALYMELAGACIDIFSMNAIEAGLTYPGATYINSTGLCLYGYQLPNNTVNDWMVAEHVARHIKPNGQYGLQYEVPELFTASGFATAQFVVDVTNEITDLDTDLMINYLESGITIDCPKGPTYLRPDDHQGLAEMYIATATNDTDPASQTHNLIIAKLNTTLDRNSVAPPIESVWNGEPYVPGGFAPPPTTTTSTGTGTGTGTQPTGGFDILTVTVVAVVTLVVGFIIAAVIFRKK